MVPLRVFAALPRALLSCLARPRCSAVSSSRAVSSTVLVNCLSRPPGPVRSSPCSLARRIISNASSRSTGDVGGSLSLFGFAAASLPAAGFFVMVSIVSVGMLITGPFPPAHGPAGKTSRTLAETVPSSTLNQGVLRQPVTISAMSPRSMPVDNVIALRATYTIRRRNGRSQPVLVRSLLGQAMPVVHSSFVAAVPVAVID